MEKEGEEEFGETERSEEGVGFFFEERGKWEERVREEWEPGWGEMAGRGRGEGHDSENRGKF